MDFEDKYTTNNRQVMSPNSRDDPQNKVARSLTPRTRRFVHQGKHDEDESVMSLERRTEEFSMQIISSFDVLQQQLTVLSDEQKQKTQGYERTIAQRMKLRMTVDGNEALSLRRQLDMKTLELEKCQFELHTTTEQAKYMFRFANESRKHHESFQQRMQNEAKRMCAYLSDERTRVFRETENMYQGKVAELQRQ
eukprot:5715221-Amphidinium_carterae.1